MRIRDFLGKVKRGVKAFVQTYKYGGFKTCKISLLAKGQLLEGKTILVTGGASGIGKAIAYAALTQKANVIITGRNSHKLEETVKEFSCKGLNCQAVVWDITKVTSFSDKIVEVESMTKNGIDILINNAGTQPKDFFPNVSEDEWNRIYETNSKGTFFMCQAFTKHWLISNNNDIRLRKIINISSQGGFVGATYPYRMSKWDIVGLTKGLGLSLADKGIFVNSIAPGVIRTEMQQRYYKQGNNVYSSENPMKRYAFPEEIAQLAVFMMSDLANFITGQTIICDGGYTLK